MNRRRLIATLSLAVPAVAVTYGGQDSESDAAYIFEPARVGSISSTVEATGTVEAVAAVDVGSQVSGLIDKVFVSFNDAVSAGQPIAQLDRAAFAARVEEAQAALKVARALARVQQSAVERADVAVASAKTARKLAEAQAAAAEARRNQAEAEFQRKLQLSRSGATSERDLDQARAARDGSDADLRAAAAQVEMQAHAIEMAEADARMAAANLENADASIAERQAVLDQAQVDLGRTIIRAPIDGAVISREVNPGQAVAVGLETKTLFRLAHDLAEMQVRGDIDEADIGVVKEGLNARFTVDAYPGRVFEGQVAQVRKAPQTVQNVVTYAAIISAPNPQRLLFPGMTAHLKIVASKTGLVLTVPNRAIDFRPSPMDAKGITSAGSSASASVDVGRVWIRGPSGSPVAVDIRMGARDDVRTEVTGGDVRNGEPLIVGLAKPREVSRILGLNLGL